MKSSNTLHKTFWQNPFVDIFKHYPISDKESVERKGEISEQHDKQIAKKVPKISGDISGANYVNIPSRKSGTSKSLGLNGRYFYLACLVPAGSIFSLHIEYKALNKTFKLSLSNLYKSTKVISDTNMQVPFSETLNKWSIVCIDSKKFLKEILDFEQGGKNRAILIPEPQDLDIEMVNLQLCAKMFIKGCYTSDNVYTPKTFPKEIAFRLSKNESFEQVYNWYTVTSFLNPAILSGLSHQAENKENKQSNTSENSSISHNKPQR